MMNKCKDTEERIYMEWLRVNKPDKWRKIQRMKLEKEHEKKHKPTKEKQQ